MRILLIESDIENLRVMRAGFKKDYLIDTASDGSEGLFLSETNNYDIIVANVILSDMSGVEVCRMLRQENITTPIILIFDTSKYTDRVMSLDAGADVNLSRPIDINEVAAQVRALVRRNGDSSNCQNKIKAGDISLDIKTRQLYFKGDPICLRRKEFDLLEYLMVHKDRVVSKEEILDHVWEKGICIFSNTVEVHIRTIRVKLGEVIGKNVIKTVRGFGYKIDA